MNCILVQIKSFGTTGTVFMLRELRCCLLSDSSGEDSNTVFFFLVFSFFQDQANAVSMTVPHVQLINPENQIVEVSVAMFETSTLLYTSTYLAPTERSCFAVNSCYCLCVRSLTGRWRWTVMKGRSRVQKQWHAISP